MQRRHKHFEWTWAAAGVFAVLGLLGACAPAEKPRPNPGTRMSSPAGSERPKGAPPVSFSAWGATDHEKAPFLVGMGPAMEGFGLKVEEVPLTREPKQDTIGASRVAYGKVVGGFGAPSHSSRAAEWSVSAR
ncbi:hypothetical protein ATI61_114176 [Archangium gephyra]|uniref:Uncharacterized protein n=1 Tax=Archangium gephyra TaxID=48 RepID=A0AAC8Q4W6_9BACT|nr:hypothetical protein [Archangium gephyra]AKJ01115.1 Hypothetical protein AA314_02741 [Archangium gephyra]REG24568.1 hypothetical protein ATI61_114176 [Archangium gephyra]